MSAQMQFKLIRQWLRQNPYLTVGEVGKMLNEAERRARNVRVFCGNSCSNISRYSYRALV